MAGAAGAIALGGLASHGRDRQCGAADDHQRDVGSIQCNLPPTKAKLKPALKDNWRKIQHDGIQGNDGGGPRLTATPKRGIEAPTGYQDDTRPSPWSRPCRTRTLQHRTGPNTVSSKSKTVSCTGNVTQTGIDTFPVGRA